MSTRQSTQERLLRVSFEALSARDLEGLRQMLHPEASWKATSKSIPGAGITRGRDKIIDEFLAPIRGLFLPGEPRVEILRIFSIGDWVAAETEAHGRLASGKPYDNRYTWIVEIRDGKICTLREYMDSAYILQQLDLKPA